MLQRRGPFKEEDFAQLTEDNWTLVVNGVDRVAPQARPHLAPTPHPSAHPPLAAHRRILDTLTPSPRVRRRQRFWICSTLCPGGASTTCRRATRRRCRSALFSLPSLPLSFFCSVALLQLYPVLSLSSVSTEPSLPSPPPPPPLRVLSQISYAPPSAGVGPHSDQYDVFLLQANGRKQWGVSADPAYRPDNADAFIPGIDVAVLREFAPETTWEVLPGDMLYLPPAVAHHGVALEEGLTWSIGFLAPRQEARGERKKTPRVRWGSR